MRELHEQNPMLGLRGVRLSIVFPGIVEMQDGGDCGRGGAGKIGGIDVQPEIMIPLIGHVNELKAVKGDWSAWPKRPPKKKVKRWITSSAP